MGGKNGRAKVAHPKSLEVVEADWAAIGAALTTAKGKYTHWGEEVPGGKTTSELAVIWGVGQERAKQKVRRGVRDGALRCGWKWTVDRNGVRRPQPCVEPTPEGLKLLAKKRARKR